MSKRLIMILTIAFVVGLTVGAYAEVQNVKLSGDMTVYGLSRALSLTSQKAENTLASIIRLRVDADLTDNVMATVRLINERYWGEDVTNSNTTGSSSTTADNTNIDLDLAYVTLKEFLYSPLTMTVGRQELHFGNDMIIGDAYTNNQASKASVFNQTIDADLSARKSFDALRATLNYDPLVIDIVGAQIRKDSRTLGVNSGGAATVESLSVDDQETLVGINANYALNKKTTVEGYFWQRRISINDKSAITITDNNIKPDYTNVVGGRVVTKATDALTLQGEVAYQSGKDNVGSGSRNKTRSAWAVETAATYDMKDVKKVGKYKPMATLLYSYFSGAKTDKKTNNAWDPMYENQTTGSIANALFDQSNVHVLGGMLSMKPMDDITLKGEYYAFWWDKRFGRYGNASTATAIATGETLAMTDKKFAAQEFDLTATYDYTEDVQFALLGGLLFPGNSFDKLNRNTAGELIGSMKVTF